MTIFKYKRIITERLKNEKNIYITYSLNDL